MQLLDYEVQHFMSCKLSTINLVWSKFLISMIIIRLCGFLFQNSTQIFKRSFSLYFVFKDSKIIPISFFGQNFKPKILTCFDFKENYFTSYLKLILKEFRFQENSYPNFNTFQRVFKNPFLSKGQRRLQWNETLLHLPWK